MAGTTGGTGGTGKSPNLQAGGKSAGTLRVELLVLQPTSFCNINCSYCYLPARHMRRRMGSETLALVAERVLRSRYVGDTLTIVWHAGEPLVLPVAYYEEAFALFDEVRPEGLRLTHSFQTNGMLLNEHWATFIRDHDVQVGVSIDGPARFHDRYRVTRDGRGTHARSMTGIRHLQAAGVDFHVISVLTAEALTAPDEFFDFYVTSGIRHVGFNVEEIEGVHTGSSLQSGDAARAYAGFMRQIMRRLEESPQGLLTVRELDGAVAIIAGPGPALPHNHQVEPLAIVSIDADGNISTFSPELLGVGRPEYGDFLFGSVHEHDLDDVLADPAFQRVRAAIDEGVRRCADTCAYFEFCGGGAPANKLFENDDLASSETLYCRLTKQTLLDAVLADYERSLGFTQEKS